jgi:protein-L-isoaspartate O-methyltransferase
MSSELSIAPAPGAVSVAPWLERAELEPGLELLDVGTGSGGNIAIPAALGGAKVVGLDVTPELFEHARRHAADAGVEVEWVEGDAQQRASTPPRTAARRSSPSTT